MKKLVLAAAAGMLAFGASAVPAFAAEGTKDVMVGYDANAIPDPEHPTDADWSVSVPKSFNFTDGAGMTNAKMGITLNDIKNGGLPIGKSVMVSVTSAKGYDLVNAKSDKLAYTLSYGAKTMTKDASKQEIGALSQGTKTIAGTSTLTGDTAKADGVYEDTLTYTVAEAK